MTRASRMDAIVTGIGGACLLLATAGIIGMPQLGVAAAFFGQVPSVQSEIEMVVLVLWIGIGAMVAWGLVAASLDYGDIRRWRRREINRRAAEIALGAVGFALLGLALHQVAAGGVHPGSVHAALALVAQSRG